MKIKAQTNLQRIERPIARRTRANATTPSRDDVSIKIRPEAQVTPVRPEAQVTPMRDSVSLKIRPEAQVVPLREAFIDALTENKG